VRLEHFAGNPAIPLRLPHRRRRKTYFQLPELNDSPRVGLNQLLNLSLKFEFSFLNGNLMVPAVHQIIFG
jgi:hypothetical protein